MFWVFFGLKACEILPPRPNQGSNPALKSEVLTAGPPGKPLFVLKTFRMKGMESPSLGDWVDSMAYCMASAQYSSWHMVDSLRTLFFFQRAMKPEAERQCPLSSLLFFPKEDDHRQRENAVSERNAWQCDVTCWVVGMWRVTAHTWPTCRALVISRNPYIDTLPILRPSLSTPT